MVGFGAIFHFLLGSHLDCLNSLHWTHVTFRKNIKVILLKGILKRPVVEVNRKKERREGEEKIKKGREENKRHKKKKKIETGERENESHCSEETLRPSPACPS